MKLKFYETKWPRAGLAWAEGEGEDNEGGETVESAGSTNTGSGEGLSQGNDKERTDAGTEASAGEKSPRESEVPKKDWRDQRLAQQTARLRQTQEQMAAVLAENERLKAGKDGEAEAKPAGTGYDESEVERRANAKATALAVQNEFNKACNAAVAAGHKDFGKESFDERTTALQGLVNLRDPAEALVWNNFIAAAIETDEAPRLLHALGGDLEEAQRIMGLSPVRMGIELAKLAAKAPEQLSQLGKPIRPVVGGRQAAHTAIDPTDTERADNLSTAAWMERREAQIWEKLTRH